MKALRLVLASLLILFLAVPSAGQNVETYFYNNFDTAPWENAPGHGFTYESLVQSPGWASGIYYDTWWYDYYIENNSTNRTIVSWTWTYEWASQTYSGAIMENPLAQDIWGDGWPLQPSSSPDLWDTSWREEAFEHASSLFPVTSTITWDDQHTEQVLVYVPEDLVPEPGSIVLLTMGALGIAGRRIIRRRQV